MLDLRSKIEFRRLLGIRRKILYPRVARRPATELGKKVFTHPSALGNAIITLTKLTTRVE
jgi:hypothetical protein